MTTTQEWKSEDLSIRAERKPWCTVEFDVNASGKLVFEAKKEAIKKVNKEVELDGFRKGKAPEATILKRFGPRVEGETRPFLAQITLAKTKELTQISPLHARTRVTFDVKALSEDGAHLTLSYETKPVVPAIDPTLFKMKPVNRREIAEAEVEEAIRQSRFFFADWKPAPDRPIREGDYIMIDLDAIENGEAKPVFQSVRFEVTEKRMARWMRELILNAKQGDVLEGLSEPDEDASVEEKAAFLPKKARIRVIKVEEPTLPPLDEEFAKKLGVLSLDELHLRIREILTQQADKAVQDALRDQVSAFLVATYPFEIPLSLIEAEKEGRKERLISDGLSEEESDKKAFEESLQVLRLFYLSMKLIDAEKLTVTQQDMAEEIRHLRSTSQEWTPEQQERAERTAFSAVVLRKAQDYILSNNLSQ